MNPKTPTTGTAHSVLSRALSLVARLSLVAGPLAYVLVETAGGKHY